MKPIYLDYNAPSPLTRKPQGPCVHISSITSAVPPAHTLAVTRQRKMLRKPVNKWQACWTATEMKGQCKGLQKSSLRRLNFGVLGRDEWAGELKIAGKDHVYKMQIRDSPWKRDSLFQRLLSIQSNHSENLSLAFPLLPLGWKWNYFSHSLAIITQFSRCVFGFLDYKLLK